MSNVKPEGPYIYQPYGMQDEAQWACKRIFAIGSLGSNLIEIKGLKKSEADLLLDFINKNLIGHKCSAEGDYYRKMIEGIK